MSRANSLPLSADAFIAPLDDRRGHLQELLRSTDPANKEHLEGHAKVLVSYLGECASKERLTTISDARAAGKAALLLAQNPLLTEPGQVTSAWDELCEVKPFSDYFDKLDLEPVTE
jgi:hypothetical protein